MDNCVVALTTNCRLPRCRKRFIMLQRPWPTDWQLADTVYWREHLWLGPRRGSDYPQQRGV